MIKIEGADIILTTSKKGWFSSAILAVLGFFQKDPVEYQHVMMALDDQLCIEAVGKGVVVSRMEDRFKDFKRYKIIRHKDITKEQSEMIVNFSKKLVGLKYSILRIALQLFDQIFHTDFFTKLLKDPTEQVCSSLAGFCYGYVMGTKFNGVDWESCEPDDIDDESLKPDSRFKGVFEWRED